MAKIGEGHAQAMGRLGLKELRNAFTPAKDSVADSEIGLYGTATQGEIAKAREGAGDGPEQESMTMAELRAAAQEQTKANDIDKEQGKNGPEQSRGMER